MYQQVFAQADFIRWQLFKYKQPTYYIFGDTKKYVELIHNDFIKFEPTENFYFNVKFRNEEIKCYDQIISGASDTKQWGVLSNTYFGRYRNPAPFTVVEGYTFDYRESRFDFLIPGKGFEKWNVKFKYGSKYDSIVIQGQGKYLGQVLGNVLDTLVNYYTKFYLKGIRIYPIKDSVCFILSKNYGFKKFLSITDLFNQSLVSYEMFGFKNSEKIMGFQPPKFEDYFKYVAGDVTLRKDYGLYIRDSITNVLRTKDSIVYTFDSQSRFIDSTKITKRYNLKNVYPKSMLGLLNSPTSWPILSNFYKMGTLIDKDLNIYTRYYALPYELLIEGKDTIIRREYRYEGSAYDSTYCSMSINESPQFGYWRNLVFDTKHGYNGFVNMSYAYNEKLEEILVVFNEIEILGYKNYDGKVEGSLDFPPVIVNALYDKFSYNQSLIIFPNPAHEQLTLKSTLTFDKLIIYQSNGNKILETTATQTIDISSLPQGLYLLEAWNLEGKRVSKKIEKR